MLNSSFRDPDGFVFTDSGIVYRKLSAQYQSVYEQFMSSGLYEKLAEKKWLIPHTLHEKHADNSLIIRPEMLPFISYPYEWSFSQLKDAALLTLNILREALKKGMVLKDASNYNVQFKGSKPIFIDTSSFELYEEGKPWVAYGQFCRHFLAPLALAAYKDVRMMELLRLHIDGIPLDLAASLLPLKTKFNLGIALHIHAHASSVKKYENAEIKNLNKLKSVSLKSSFQLIEHLERTIASLSLTKTKSTWGDYYEDGILSDAYLAEKKDLVHQLIAETQANSVWDIGANNGVFSRIAERHPSVKWTVAMDFDHNAVDNLYLSAKSKTENIIPIVIDLSNPSPRQGWANNERGALLDRPKPQLALALALIHHLRIGNNVPIAMLPDFFSQTTQQYLIIEMVPKSDEKVKKLLTLRKDIFEDYTVENFEKCFGNTFDILKKIAFTHSTRLLYLMAKKNE
jgi:hypothetical protein